MKPVNPQVGRMLAYAYAMPNDFGERVVRWW